MSSLPYLLSAALQNDLQYLEVYWYCAAGYPHEPSASVLHVSSSLVLIKSFFWRKHLAREAVQAIISV